MQCFADHQKLYNGLTDAIKAGAKRLKEFLETGKQGCYIAPALFKIYLFENFKLLQASYHTGIPIREDLYDT